MKWQSIETAPKDGRYIIVDVPSFGMGPSTLALWQSSMNQWSAISTVGPCKFTHWMPLPEPPK